ncbi:hypothetical protein AGMMS49574_11230 [Bacteroidia bacterium]|nr:hypothetical protein AGMMS49574_11230 [Bacteroidia bacterium]
MKKVILLFTATVCMTLSGCNKSDEPDNSTTGSSKIIAKTSQSETTRSDENKESVVFTGDNILWVNESSKEIRFTDNMAISTKIPLFHGRSINFYIGDEFLFSSLIYINDFSSYLTNSPVFYYSVMENKFYIKDGYPNIRNWSNSEDLQRVRDENMKKIEPEWNKFIQQVKAEGKYKNEQETPVIEPPVTPPVVVTPTDSLRN